MNTFIAFTAAISFATMPVQHNAHAVRDAFQTYYIKWAEENYVTVVTLGLPLALRCAPRMPGEHEKNDHRQMATNCHAPRASDGRLKAQRSVILEQRGDSAPFIS